MPAAQAETIPAADAGHKASFFRQSGWLMIANVGGGMLMWAVHFLAKRIPESEYGVFGAFLAVVMVLPTMPLQMVLAQQTAQALAKQRPNEVSGVIRLFWLGTALIWLVAAVLVLVFQNAILARWQLHDPIGLWLTLPIVLFSIWMPMFWGVLQGQQNFLWLGWSMILNGIGRIGVAAAAVLLLHQYSSGMLSGVLLGILVAFGIAAWQTRGLWTLTPAPFDWRGLLRQVTPLLLAFLGFQILFTADTLLVKSYFSAEDAGFYVSAGTLSRALMWLVLPLASVMFPRMVHSATRGDKSNLMGTVLLGTAVLAIAGVLGLWLLGPFVVKFVYKQSYVAVATAILPWYAAAMVPLAMGNVLLNNLLASPNSRMAQGFAILAVAAAYLFALTQFHNSLLTVLKIMGLSNLVFLGLCAWFTWGSRPSTQPRPSA
jgi:O-antigen/teichoic acid export membrane protein